MNEGTTNESSENNHISPYQMLGIEVYSRMLHSPHVQSNIRRQWAAEQRYANAMMRLEMQLMGIDMIMREALGGPGRRLPPATEATEDHVDPCTICIGPITKQDAIHILRCGHCFHTDCLRPWGEDHQKETCPVCRQPLFNETYESTNTPSSSHAASDAQQYSSHPV